MSRIFDELRASEAVAGTDSDVVTEGEASCGRRSFRLSLVIPIIIEGTDADGNEFKENTWTVSVSRHGGKLTVFRRLSLGSEITIENPIRGPVVKGRVVRVEKKGFQEDPYEVVVELLGPAAVWGVKFPPEDWTQPSSAVTSDPSVGACGGSSEIQRSANRRGPVLVKVANGVVGAVGENGDRRDEQVPSVAIPATDFMNLNTGSATRVKTGAESLPKTVESSRDVEDLFRRLESLRSALEILVLKAQEAEEKLKREAEATAGRLVDLSAHALDSAWVGTREKLRQESESLLSTLIESLRNRMTQCASEEFAACDRQWAARLRDLSARSIAASAQMEAQTVQLSARGREHAERAVQEVANHFAGTLPSMIEEATSRCRRDLEKSIGESVGALVSAGLEEASAALEREKTSFGSTLEAMKNRIEKEIADREWKARESLAAQAEELSVEVADRVSARIKENSRSLDGTVQQEQRVSREEVERFRERLAEVSASALEHFVQSAEAHASGAQAEFVQGLQSIQESAVPGGQDRLQQAAEGIIESLTKQMYQQTSDALVLHTEALGKNALRLAEDFGQRLSSSTRRMADLIDRRAEAAEAGLRGMAEEIRSSAQKRLADAEKQLAARAESSALSWDQKTNTLQAECLQRLNERLSESAEACIGMFERRLEMTEKERYEAVVAKLGETLEVTKQTAVGQVQSELHEVAHNSIEEVHQQLGAAILALKDWKDQTTVHVEGALKDSMDACQKGIGDFSEAALNEFQRGIRTVVEDLRKRMIQATDGLQGLGLPERNTGAIPPISIPSEGVSQQRVETLAGAGTIPHDEVDKKQQSPADEGIQDLTEKQTPQHSRET